MSDFDNLTNDIHNSLSVQTELVFNMPSFGNCHRANMKTCLEICDVIPSWHGGFGTKFRKWNFLPLFV